ncbi:hypothetical protein GCM10023238_39060 [Streptomyces heliomycini]
MWRPLPDLADLAGIGPLDEDTVLVLIEQEGGWFGVVRVDGEEDPRVYVSDAAPPPAAATARSCSPTSCSAGNPGRRPRPGRPRPRRHGGR